MFFKNEQSNILFVGNYKKLLILLGVGFVIGIVVSLIYLQFFKKPFNKNPNGDTVIDAVRNEEIKIKAGEIIIPDKKAGTAVFTAEIISNSFSFI